MTRSSTILSILSLLAALAFAGWFAGLVFFIRDAERLAPIEPLQKLDAIVVLTGGSNRLDAGFDLLAKGFGKKLFISGVSRGLDVKQLLKLWKDEPQDNLDCCVVLGFDADNTIGNAVETAVWLRQENFRAVYLVTASYHIRRALLEFSHAAPDVRVIPFPVAAGKTPLNLAAREYMKYLFVHLFYSVIP